MNAEDEVHYQGRTGCHTFEILCDVFTSEQAGTNRWTAWEGPRLIAYADTRDEVIEKAKRIVDGRIAAES